MFVCGVSIHPRWGIGTFLMVINRTRTTQQRARVFEISSFLFNDHIRLAEVHIIPNTDEIFVPV